MKWLIILLVASMVFIGCLSPSSTSSIEYGKLSFRILAPQSGPFKQIAKTATVTIVAPDITQIKKSLAVTDSGVEGILSDIPAGKGRLFTIQVFDSSGMMQYQGNSTVDIIAGSLTSIQINIFRIVGAASINGIVVENQIDYSLTSKRIIVGAQLEEIHGGLIELDSLLVWKFDSPGLKGNDSKIDLVFAFSATVASAAIYSPYTGKNGIGGTPGLSLMQAMNTPNITEIKSVKANYQFIEKQSQVDSLWETEVVDTYGRIVLTQGKTFLAKSHSGVIYLLQVDPNSKPAMDAYGSQTLFVKTKI